MAIDPSIPLQFRGVDVGAMLDQAQARQIRQMQLEEARAKMQSDQAERDAYGQLFAGGMNGGQQGRPDLGPLARVNPEAAFKIKQYFDGLDADAHKQEADKYKAAAPLLLRVKQLPYEQRRAFIQSASPVLMANGWTPQELQSFDPTDQAVDALSSAAMTINDVTDAMRLHWNQIGENGSFATDNMGNPVGTGNPFAPKPQIANRAPPSNDSVFGALIQQESGGKAGIKGQKTAYGVPLGRTQLLPQTAQEMAGKLGLPWRPELLTGTSAEASAYQDQLGRAYFDEGLQKYGGNLEKALMYYHGGPDESKWGPRTRTYAKAVLARTGGAKGNPDMIRAQAQAAIRAGADPEAVRQRALALGVTL